MSAHSPGPWRWEDDVVKGELQHGARRLVDADGRSVFWPWRRDDIPSVDIAWSSETDARLIAAAPELLALVERLAGIAQSEIDVSHAQHCGSGDPIRECRNAAKYGPGVCKGAQDANVQAIDAARALLARINTP